jgi:glycine/D-amino acid oxidase-like deaminating enzyme/nitrite reductase/ring-hydroxylating ferredoxin subunit
MTVTAIHHSYWRQRSPLEQRFPALEGSHVTDVLIIGAGITGLSLADELLDRGYQVTLCEAGVVGSGTTGASSGHLDAHPEMGPRALLRRLGTADARQMVSMRLKAVDKVIKRSSGRVDVVTVPGFHYTELESEIETMREECAAARELGLPATWADNVPIPLAKAGYQIAGLARMDSLQYAKHLATSVAQRGGVIFEDTKVEGPSEARPTSLPAGRGHVQFKHVVCAAHSNISNSLRLYLETPAYQSYCLVARVETPPSDALFWDTAEPYHYTCRVGAAGENLVLIGGCDHRTGLGDELEAQRELESWVRDRFEVQEIIDQWSAELFEPTDGLPLIGRVAGKENVWIATGLSGVGLTQGTMAGELIADEIAGRPTPRLAERLAPSRLGLANIGQLVAEQVTSARNYAERVLPAEHIDVATLQPGEGAVGKVDGQFVAVCRDKDGCEHRLDPACAHMGGVVHWNEAEQTWDCPVHGGRYQANGERLYGPPMERLKAKD